MRLDATTRDRAVSGGPRLVDENVRVAAMTWFCGFSRQRGVARRGSLGFLLSGHLCLGNAA